jgi:hypothetical protein
MGVIWKGQIALQQHRACADVHGLVGKGALLLCGHGQIIS